MKMRLLFEQLINIVTESLRSTADSFGRFLRDSEKPLRSFVHPLENYFTLMKIALHRT